jgi:hypothetical protein
MVAIKKTIFFMVTDFDGKDTGRTKFVANRPAPL